MHFFSYIFQRAICGQFTLCEHALKLTTFKKGIYPFNMSEGLLHMQKFYLKGYFHIQVMEYC